MNRQPDLGPSQPMVGWRVLVPQRGGENPKKKSKIPNRKRFLDSSFFAADNLSHYYSERKSIKAYEVVSRRA